MNNMSRYLVGKASDPSFWKKVREDGCYERFRNELFSMWRDHCEGKDTQALIYSDFRLFFTTGDRAVYEKKYFGRRLAMDCAALLSLVYPENDGYLAKLQDVVWCICDEYTWCLPAHQRQNGRADSTVIDLFAAETGFALAEILTMLGDRLDPVIRDRISVEIRRRIIGPFTSVENYGWWEHGTNNWTAVCSGSVACTAMLTDPDLARALIPRFERSMECFLSGFSGEGICYEGAGYWCYGFGFFTVYADMLRRFTGGKIDHFKDPKVKKIAAFHQKIFLSGRSTASFSDGGVYQSYHLGLQHYLKKEYPDVISVLPPSMSYNCDGCGRFCLHVRSATWLDPDILKDSEDAAPGPAEYFFPEAGWLIKRTAEYGFAAKGGTNDEPHNHNDAGSFIFAAGGHHALTDLGSGRYCRQYFEPENRYSFTECSSRGHSVPIVGGSFQKPGREFAAADVSFEGGVLSMDIAPAYGVPALKKLIRRFSFAERGITVADRFDFEAGKEEAVTERFVTRTEPVISDGKVTVGGAVMSGWTSSEGPFVASEDISSGRCWFIDFELPAGTADFSVKITVAGDTL